jgi:hypothetical protein
MGTWNTKINGSDVFQDIYNSFFDLYNQGVDPHAVAKQIQDDFAEMFADADDRNNSLFGLALAQWETKTPDPGIFQKVKEIIETGDDLGKWKNAGADDKTLKSRKAALDKFLVQLSTEKEKPKRRVKPKNEFKRKEIIKITAPDGRKTFTVSESFSNGEYDQTGSLLLWQDGGCAILYFEGEGKYISAKWKNSQTLVITHDRSIVFTKRDETFYFCGDQGKVVYVPTDLFPVK